MIESPRSKQTSYSWVPDEILLRDYRVLDVSGLVESRYVPGFYMCLVLWKIFICVWCCGVQICTGFLDVHCMVLWSPVYRVFNRCACCCGVQICRGFLDVSVVVESRYVEGF